MGGFFETDPNAVTVKLRDVRDRLSGPCTARFDAAQAGLP